MTGNRLLSLAALAALSAVAAHPRPAEPASHQWRFNELFSNADGTVQFVEMKECCGFTDELALGGKWILAVDANHRFDFPRNLTGNTANRHLLLATQGFADLPGAPAPDYIIPDGFLPTDGDVLEYWMYDNATVTYGPLPTDGVTSLDPYGSTVANSPTNYAGESGSIDVTPVRPSTWGLMKAIYW